MQETANKKHAKLIQYIFPLLVLLGAFYLYTSRLGEASIWRDEALSIGRARLTVAQIFQNQNVIDTWVSVDLHPPLYFLLLHIWHPLMGESEFAYRYPSVLAMLLALVLIYKLSGRVWGQDTAVFTLLLAAVSPFFFWYAQEARMYALLVFESTLLLWCLWPLMVHSSTNFFDYVKLFAAATLLVYTHYTGLFLVTFALGALLLMRFSRRIMLIMVSGGILVFLVAIPLYDNISQLLASQGFVAFIQQSPWILFTDALGTFTLGAAERPVDRFWRLIPFGILLLIGLWPSQKNGRWSRLLFGAGSFFITLLGFYTASFIQANYSNPRHLTVLSVPLMMLLGHGLAVLKRQHLWLTAVVLLPLALSGEALWQTATNPSIIKDDMRALVDYLAPRIRDGDVLVWHDASSYKTYEYYAVEGVPTTILEWAYRGAPPVEAAELAEWAKPYQRIWFIDASLKESRLRDWLDANWETEAFAQFPGSWQSLHLSLLERPWSAATPPEDAHPIDLNQSGYTIHAAAWDDPFVSGQGTWVDVYWSATEQARGGSGVCLKVQDSPLEACRPLEAKTAGLHHEALWVELPRGLRGERPLIIRVEDASMEIAQVSIAPYEPVDRSALANWGQVNLLEIEWNDQQFLPSSWVNGSGLWQSTAHGRYQIEGRLVNWWNQPLVAAEAMTVAVEDDSGQRVTIPWRLPDDAPSGRYWAQLRLLDEAGNPLGNGRWQTIDTVEVIEWPFISGPPADIPPAARDIIFAESITLFAYKVTPTAENDMWVQVVWKVEHEMAQNWGVFVHLGQPNEPPIAQVSNGPVNWTRPTAGWRSGEYIRDSYVIDVPEGVAWEAYSVQIGFFDLEDPNVRAPLTVNGEGQPSGSVTLESNR
ncbi:MAG: glycosyltransferase family 39 protein [Anaerolineales bacterium]|nr:glycosyltransferase family 39 protein [Anaerolineales bacterium]